jgi:hypothetical protein
MKNKIREFIENNVVYFEEGSRNSTIITLIGYAQYLGLSKEDLEKELQEEIEVDGVIQEEIDRLWSYASSNNYAKYWKTAQAKKDWKF